MTPELARGVSYLSVAQRPLEAALAFHLVAVGGVDELRARRQFRLNDRVTEVRSLARAIRSRTGPALGLWLVSETGQRTSDDAPTEDLRAEAGPWAASLATENARFEIAALDGRWRVTATELKWSPILGHERSELGDLPIVDLLHRDDLGVFLLALARATTDDVASARLRLQRRDGSTFKVCLVAGVSAAGDDPRFVITVSADATGHGPDQLLDRDELARLLPLQELPPRQREVVQRLARGERVATIAAAMYLSRSTVRNHLTAIFGKFGVHSQEELLTLLRATQGEDPRTK
jgi:DNA-binding CsgD family transcriptional regulator/PAS domain-containing protein